MKSFVEEFDIDIEINKTKPIQDYDAFLDKKLLEELRNKIIQMGGEFRFNSCLTNINIENEQIKSIEINKKEGAINYRPCFIQLRRVMISIALTGQTSWHLPQPVHFS